MRQPPPSLASYMQAINSSESTSTLPADSQKTKAVPEFFGNKEAMQGMIQNEMKKYKMFQEKKTSLQHELTMVEQNLLKIQGSLEVFQAMGFIKLN